jgi:hypothetical protein
VRLGTALRLASVIALASSRGRREGGRTPGGLSKYPVTNLLFSAVIFPVVFLLILGFVGGPRGEDPLLGLLYSQAMIFLPSLLAFLSMMYSFMTEFSQSAGAASTDMVNWLPITVGEFVLGSSLTTMYFISPMVSALLGASLALAFATGMTGLWAFSGLLGLLGCFLGAFSLEVVRALLNRTSQALSRRGGQSALIIRMILSVLLFAAFSIIFNVSFLTRIVGWFAGSISGAWIVPLLWPSLAILSHLGGDSTGALAYSVLSVALTSAFFWLGVLLRARYWAPEPVSVRLRPARKGARERGLLGGLGFTAAEAAIIRKDLRSLVRRREMVSLLSFPVMMTLMALINSGPNVLWDPASSFLSKLSFLAQIGVGIIFFANYVALSAMGQEGEAFGNLRAAPLEAAALARAKAFAALLPSLAGFAVIMALYVAFTRGVWGTTLSIAVVGFSLLVEASLLGLAVGSHFPDFRETPRARFFTLKGGILSLLTLSPAALATVAPVYLSDVMNLSLLSLPAATAVSLVIAITVSVLSYKTAVSGVERLLRNAPS